MQIEKQGDVYYVSGSIATANDLETIKFTERGRVRLDMGGIKTLNSQGVRAWVNWIRSHDIIPTYVNCSAAFVSQLGMVKELLGKGTIVESIQIPASCTVCKESKIFVLEQGVDYFPGKEVAEFFPPKCSRADCGIEFDVDLEIYMEFALHLDPDAKG